MTRLASCWPFKKFAERARAWWAAEEATARAAYAEQVHQLQAELMAGREVLEGQVRALETQQREVEELRQRLQDRKEELARANEELRAQVRLLEAKASPNEVYIQALTTGYQLAWQTMLPLMQAGLQESRKAIRDAAITETLANLEPVAAERRATKALVAKREEFARRLERAASQREKEKYQDYLQALDWALNGYRLPAHP